MALATESATAREGPPEGPRFGLATATFVVVSSMIGTGVLTTSGFTVYFVGSNQLMLALWVVGGLLALCGALTLCELSAALPRSGGDYVFLLESYGPLAAFLSGWVSFLIGFGGPIAASASAAANYVLAPLRLDDAGAAIAQPVVASVAIIGLGVIHCMGRGSTVRAQAGMTAIKIGILVVLAVAGLAAGHRIADPLSVAIGLTLLASVSAYILTGPRVAFAMARAGQFPEIAGRLSSRGAPAITTSLQVVWSLVLLWTASFERILLYSSVGLASFSMLTVSAVYVLRHRRPDLPRPFLTPGYPIVPAVYLIGTGLLTAAIFYERPVVSSISVPSIALGMPAYYLRTFTARSNGAAP